MIVGARDGVADSKADGDALILVLGTGVRGVTGWALGPGVGGVKGWVEGFPENFYSFM